MAYVGRKIRIAKLSQKTRDTCIQGHVAYDSRHGAGQGDGGYQDSDDGGAGK